MRALALLGILLASTSVGCLDDLESRLGLGGEDEVVVPAAITLTGFVTPGFTKNEPFDVPAGMSQVTLDIELSVKGAPAAPPLQPATLDVELKDAGGATVGEKKTLQGNTAKGQIVATSPPPGEYTVALKGNGLSDGKQGAAYTVTIGFAG